MTPKADRCRDSNHAGTSMEATSKHETRAALAGCLCAGDDGIYRAHLHKPLWPKHMPIHSSLQGLAGYTFRSRIRESSWICTLKTKGSSPSVWPSFLSCTWRLANDENAIKTVLWHKGMTARHPLCLRRMSADAVVALPYFTFHEKHV